VTFRHQVMLVDVYVTEFSMAEWTDHVQGSVLLKHKVNGNLYQGNLKLAQDLT
jgi:hypothetical protein